MQDPNMQKIIDGLTEIGHERVKAGDGETALLSAGASGMVAALCQLNDTLEEIRDAIKESKS
jgi:hypothetical protein